MNGRFGHIFTWRGKRRPGLLPIWLALVIVASCSTTRVLSEDQEWLAKNKIIVKGDKQYNGRELQPYLKQKENNSFLFGWKPFLYVYNWQDGKGKGWDKFVKKIGDPPVIFEEGQVSSSERSLLGHLDYTGYYHSKVSSEVVRKKPKEVTVTYYVEPGPRRRIDSLVYQLPADSTLRAIFCADTVNSTVRKGTWLSEKALDAEADRASAYLRNKGYYGWSKAHFSYEADTISRPGQTILTVKVAHTVEKRDFGPVTIDYPAPLKFNEKVLRGLNTIRPGTPYSEEVVNNTYSRLTQLSLFSSVSVETSVGEDGRVHSAIRLSQSKLQGFKLNLQVSTNTNWLFAVTPQISYFHKNIFGGGELLNVSLRTNHQFLIGKKLSSNEVGASVSLRFPKFLLLPYSAFPRRMPHTEIKGTFTFQHRPEFRRFLVTGAFGYVGNFNNLLSYQFYPISLGVIRIPYIDANFLASMTDNPFLLNSFEEHLDAGINGTLFFKTSPQAVPKESYFYSRFNLDLSGNLISLFNKLLPTRGSEAEGSEYRVLFGLPYYQYARGELSLVETLRLGKDERQSLVFRLLIGAGIGYGNSISMPFEKLFYAGGSNSMRGWQARTLGPGAGPMYDYFVIPSQVADAKFEFNVEYRFPMFWKIEGAAFVDVGNIYNIFRNTQYAAPDVYKSAFSFDHLESLAANWGVGLRLNLDFIVIRVDAGLRFHDPQYEKRWVEFKRMFSKNGAAIHFGIGYPF